MEKDENQDVELEQETNEEEVEEVEEEEVQEDEESQEEESVEDDTDWKAEALKYKAIAERNKKKSIKKPLETKAQSPDEDDVKSDVAYLKFAERKRQFGYENGLSPKETDKVFQVNPNPDSDTLKDPFVKAGLEAIRRQDRVSQNTPSTSAKAGTFDRKKFKDATPEEKQAAFDKYMKSKVQ